MALAKSDAGVPVTISVAGVVLGIAEVAMLGAINAARLVLTNTPMPIVALMDKRRLIGGDSLPIGIPSFVVSAGEKVPIFVRWIGEERY